MLRNLKYFLNKLWARSELNMKINIYNNDHSKSTYQT